MAVDYSDDRFTQVENQKASALEESNAMYDSLMQQRNDLTTQQTNLVDTWQQTQNRIANDNLNYQLDTYKQQQEQAEKDYQKEAKASYTDYQKEINQYGANAETLASQGLQNSGYSESSKVSMYTTYQNRLASARESYQTAVLEYQNSIKEAKLNNNTTLAENAYQALQDKLDIMLEAFDYTSEMTLNKQNSALSIDQDYYQRYQDVLSQINTENELAEQQRQFDEEMAENKRQFDEEMAYNWANYYNSGSSSSGSSSSSSSSSSYSLDDGTSLSSGSSSSSSSGTTYTSKSAIVKALGLSTAGSFESYVNAGYIDEITDEDGKTYYVAGSVSPKNAGSLYLG